MTTGRINQVTTVEGLAGKKERERERRTEGELTHPQPTPSSLLLPAATLAPVGSGRRAHVLFL